jgi:hypothetical protein
VRRECLGGGAGQRLIHSPFSVSLASRYSSISPLLRTSSSAYDSMHRVGLRISHLSPRCPPFPGLELLRLETSSVTSRGRECPELLIQGRTTPQHKK